MQRRMARDRLSSAVVSISTAVDARWALDFVFTSPAMRHVLHEAMIPSGPPQCGRDAIDA